MILIFGCLRRIVSLVLLLALACVVWWYRAPIVAAWHRFRGQAPPAAGSASPEEARRSAEAKLAALQGARPPARTALSEPELQALMQTRFAPVLPRWVDSARIELDGEQVRLSGRVPVDRMPQIKSLGELAGLLPDTTEVAVKGQVIPLPHGRVALAVDQVTAAHVPLPRRLLPQVLAGLKKGAPADLPADALPLPLPSTITSAYVRNDSLILFTSGAGAPAPAPAASRRR